MLEILLGVFIFLVIAYVTKELLRRFDPRLPPGPWGLPVFGYSRYLSTSPHEDYCKLAKKYGPVFGLHIGGRYTVILCDYPSVKEAFNKEEFLDRPQDFQFFDDENIVSMNGWKWKETRRFFLTTLRTLGMGKNKVEQRILEEITLDLENLEKLGPETEVNLEDFFSRSFANNIFSIINGLNLEESSHILTMIKDFKNHIFTAASTEFIFYNYPTLNAIFHYFRKFGMKGIKPEEVHNYFSNEIKSHEENFDSFNKEDFFDYYIEEIKKNEGKKTSFTRPNMMSNAQMLLLAGLETTQTTLDWQLLCLAKYPEMQEKMYKELISLLGKERPPSWNDRESLPYTSAFILEVQRCRTIGPAGDPHKAGRAGTIRGYHIPEGTNILANLYAIHNDQSLWGDPENFRPERFLSSEGKLVTPEYWMPFLIGKRSCPGEKLASMQIFIFVTSIVQKFEVIPPKSGLSLTGMNAGMYIPIKPVVSFRRRD